MVVAIVLIQVKAKTAEEVIKAIESIEHVEKVHMVTGPYDVIAYAELPSRGDFRRFVNDIHDVEGVLRTETCVGI
jgi:DNA-binding Lrp family transcriptional regulator